jgi:glycosyltransferase involved in cell wall biosynthesis
MAPPRGRAPALLIVNPHLPVFPGGGGVEALTTRHLAGLAEAVGLVSQIHGDDDLPRVQPLADAGVQLYLWRGAQDRPHVAPARAAVALADARDALAASLRGRPADTLIWGRALRRLAEPLARAQAERHWPIALAVESPSAPVRPLLHARTAILVMHDVRTRLFASRARSAAGAARVWWRLQAQLYRRFETRWCRRFDLVTTVSEEDASWVRAHAAPREVVVVPLPLDAAYFAPREGCAERPGRIVFTGLMNHPPNADAAVFFARQVLPRVRARLPEAHFQVVGRQPAPAVSALARLPGVEVCGAVPDVRPHLAEAQVVVVPLRFGAGARQKILEAWALQRCVVSTTLGAEGLGARDGDTLLLADGAEALAERVVAALRDPALREAVRRPGRTRVLMHHDPGRIAAGLYDRMRRAASTAPE